MRIVVMNDKSRVTLVAENAAEEIQLQVLFRELNDWRMAYEKDYEAARVDIYVTEFGEDRP